MLVVAADMLLRARLERELTVPVLPFSIVTAEIAGVAALRAAHPRAPIVVVGVARGQIAAVLDAGADAALPGIPRPDELRARLRAVARRRGSPLCVGPLEVEPWNRSARLAGAPLELPAREFEVLAYLASAPGRIVTKDELARRCWQGSARDPEGRALERCLSRLRRRLGRHAPMLVTVWGVGYRLAEPD